MTWVYISLSIIVIVFANIIKVFRLSLFIEKYDRPNTDILARALAIGNMINFVAPLRLGVIYRILHSSKNAKYGKSFMFSTIVTEIVVDFICVSGIYIIISLCGISSKESLTFYALCLLTFFAICIVLKIFKKAIKKSLYYFAKIFNESIELKILKSTWFTIVSFKNIVKRTNIIKILLYSIIMWSLNILSCYLLTVSMNNISFLDMFNYFYSNSGITSSIFLNVFNYTNDIKFIIVLYFTLSSLILFIVSFLLKNIVTEKKKYIELTPHANLKDRLNFISLYFNNDDNSKYYKEYLKVNNDIVIIEDYSAGSNATTMLCEKNDKLFYRKYSFGSDAKKLKDQIDWIKEHQKKLTLTKIIDYSYKNDLCCYDMPYIKDTVTCFNYVHTMPFNDSWNVLKMALDDIDKNLHNINKRTADVDTINKYIDSKVLANIEKIENGEYIKPFIKFDYIYINGKKYKNLKNFKKYLLELFKNDNYSDIHGDFTIENIICIKNSKSKKNYYIIDPNTGNLHNSPYLDFAKLLQSIHGGYEFLMNTKTVSFENDKINFIFAKSSVYDKLLERYKKYLMDKFGVDALKSIFYHEVIHWLRLMPYKIEKNAERSLLFYAGLIMVLNDVEEMFEK